MMCLQKSGNYLKHWKCSLDQAPNANPSMSPSPFLCLLPVTSTWLRPLTHLLQYSNYSSWVSLFKSLVWPMVPALFASLPTSCRPAPACASIPAVQRLTSTGPQIFFLRCLSPDLLHLAEHNEPKAGGLSPAWHVMKGGRMLNMHSWMMW